MGQYTNKGLYNRYDRNNRTRDKLDYYSTKPGETKNILDALQLDFSGLSILEPSYGGGHMIEDIDKYLAENNQQPARKIGTDIKDRGYYNSSWELVAGLDTLHDDYPYESADVVIMNPPFSTIEPFVIRGLEIAKKHLIVFARLQFLEGVGRYENIFKDNPPTDVYIYIDRIQCWKDGVEPEGSSAQCYAWFYWDMERAGEKNTQCHWLHRR